MRTAFMRNGVSLRFNIFFLGVAMTAWGQQATTSVAAQLAPPAREIPLYSGVAPGSEGWAWNETTVVNASGTPIARNVVRPVLMYYPADKAKAIGTAVIVAPGGGYRNLMMSYEGVDIAKRLNAMGIDSFVLKYRLVYTDPNAAQSSGRGAAARGGNGPEAAARAGGRAAAGPGQPEGQDAVALAKSDGSQAVRIVRQHATEFGVRPDRIGMIGFSAGGGVVLASVTGPADGRPNFAMPIYSNDAGSTAPPSDGPAPPLFIAVAADDQAVGRLPGTSLKVSDSRSS